VTKFVCLKAVLVVALSSIAEVKPGKEFVGKWRCTKNKSILKIKRDTTNTFLITSSIDKARIIARFNKGVLEFVTYGKTKTGVRSKVEGIISFDKKKDSLTVYFIVFGDLSEEYFTYKRISRQHD